MAEVRCWPVNAKYGPILQIGYAQLIDWPGNAAYATPSRIRDAFEPLPVGCVVAVQATAQAQQLLLGELRLLRFFRSNVRRQTVSPSKLARLQSAPLRLAVKLHDCRTLL